MNQLCHRGRENEIDNIFARQIHQRFLSFCSQLTIYIFCFTLRNQHSNQLYNMRGKCVCVCVLWESEWSSMINHFLLTLVGVCTAACFHVHLCASKCVCVCVWPISAVIITEGIHTHTHTDSAARGEGVNSEVRGQGLNNHWAVLAQTLVQWLTTSAIH